MNDKHVGILSRDKGEQSFTYSQAWLEDKQRRPLSLSMPLREEPWKGQVVEAWFDNLLPDNENIRQAIVDRLGAQSRKSFDLLALLGKDCVGAITLLTEQSTLPLEAVQVEKLSEAQIADIIRHTRTDNLLGMQARDSFRISIAGAQEKTALTWWDNAWCRPLGKTATTHIIKPPISSRNGDPLDLSNSVDNEWFCLHFLDEMGLKANRCDIGMFAGQKVLIVERFDRLIVDDKIYRLPQEDLCQASGKAGQSKYEEHGGPDAKEVARLLRYAIEPTNNLEIFFKAQFCFWLLAAIDGHAKNFSLFLTADGYRLTPLYDVMSAHPWFGKGIEMRKTEMAMSVRGSKNKHYRWYEILPRHWMTHARYLGINTELASKWLAECVERTPGSLEKVMKQLPQHFERQTAEKIVHGTLNTLQRFQRQQQREKEAGKAKVKDE
ncbi:type II toxin-antitoxin system HipA family toxin [Erwinia mallotivora]|uniref:type II toxin-antitoxin system HipA family toxin n=1 Tax=Erwinia mallotivora TaxID=69222 RepID=UPI0035E9429C